MSSIVRKHTRTQVEVEQRKIKKLRKCPQCAEEIQLDAKICHYCRLELPALTEDDLLEIEQRYSTEVSNLNPELKKCDKAQKAQNKKDWSNL